MLMTSGLVLLNTEDTTEQVLTVESFTKSRDLYLLPGKYALLTMFLVNP